MTARVMVWWAQAEVWVGARAVVRVGMRVGVVRQGRGAPLVDGERWGIVRASARG